MRLIYLCKGRIDSDLLVVDEAHGTCSSDTFGASNFSLRVVTFDAKGNAESDAKWLSSIALRFEEAGVERLVLEDDASAYFEQRLYERFARFERKLRAALYLNIALREGRLDDQLVADLEVIDFGTLFGRFFVDDRFVDGYRKLLGGKDGRFEKADLLAEIDALEENAKWDQLFDADELAAIKEHHGLIRNVRNDVMHAHPMSAGTYRLGAEALDEALIELDAYLLGRLKRRRARSTFNDALRNVLAAYEASSALVSSDVMSRIADSYAEAGPALEQSMKRLADSFATARELDVSGFVDSFEALQRRFDEWGHLPSGSASDTSETSGEKRIESRDDEED